jgi:hypothetical protein
MKFNFSVLDFSWSSVKENIFFFASILFFKKKETHFLYIKHHNSSLGSSSPQYTYCKLVLSLSLSPHTLALATLSFSPYSMFQRFVQGLLFTAALVHAGRVVSSKTYTDEACETGERNEFSWPENECLKCSDYASSEPFG